MQVGGRLHGFRVRNSIAQYPGNLSDSRTIIRAGVGDSMNAFERYSIFTPIYSIFRCGIGRLVLEQVIIILFIDGCFLTMSMWRVSGESLSNILRAIFEIIGFSVQSHEFYSNCEVHWSKTRQ